MDAERPKKRAITIPPPTRVWEPCPALGSSIRLAAALIVLRRVGEGQLPDLDDGMYLVGRDEAKRLIALN